MTAPEIRGEKTTLYGYTLHVVRKVGLTVDEKGLHVEPAVYIVVEHLEDEKGCYVYRVAEDGGWTYGWLASLSVAEMYREIKDKVDELYTTAREKLAAFSVIKDLLEKEGVVVDARCWGYYKDKKAIIKELQ